MNHNNSYKVKLWSDYMFSKLVREVIADNGDEVKIREIPLSRVYTDPESEELSKKYDVHSNIGFVSSSLASTNTESFADDLFRFYSALGCFCGFSRKELEKVDNDKMVAIERVNPVYIRRRCIEGVEVLFPTEELLKNQRISKYKRD